MLIPRKQIDIDKSPEKPTKSELENLQKIAKKQAEEAFEKALKKSGIPFKKK